MKGQLGASWGSACPTPEDSRHRQELYSTLSPSRAGHETGFHGVVVASSFSSYTVPPPMASRGEHLSLLWVDRKELQLGFYFF